MNPMGLARAGTTLAAAILLALGGCRDADTPHPRTGEAHARHPSAPPAGEASEHSIYHLDGTWLDQGGRELSLSDLAGRIQVVAMVYTHCSYACPRILAQMKRMEGAVADEAAKRVGFALVSIDPERDRPDRLGEFAEQSRLNPERWTLLNGSEEDLLGLSVLLGVKYRSTGQGEFSHSNVITVLDEEGVIVDRVEGLSADLDPTIDTIRALLRRPAGER